MEHVCKLLAESGPEVLVELVRDAVHAWRFAARQAAEAAEQAAEAVRVREEKRATLSEIIKRLEGVE